MIAGMGILRSSRRCRETLEKLTPLTFEAHVQDLLALARREHERGPVILFGHSYGGVVTLGAALTQPSLVEIVLVYEAPLPFVLPREGSHAPLGGDPWLEAERFFRRLVSDGAWERLSELERDSRRRDGPALLCDLTSLRGGNLQLDLAALSVPTTYAYGDERTPEYYRALSQALAQLNPLIQSRELHKAGHGAHLSIPDQLATLIETLWNATCASA